MMSGTLTRTLAIVRLADRLLREAGVDAAPVSTGLVQTLHPEIEILPAPLGPVASSLVIPGPASSIGKVRLFFHERQSIPRQRFSIAHEYGHYLLHHLKLLDSEAPTDPALREAEADRFASSLLVPLWLLDQAAENISYNAEDKTALERMSYRLASRFNVSRSCMNRALFELFHLRKAFEGNAAAKHHHAQR